MNPGPASAPPGIVAEGVGFGFDGPLLFQGLNFAVPTGQVYALVGRSGIGKTTLLHLVLGLYAPQGGQVQVDGKPSRPGCIRGAVFREESLLGWLTVEQNILFPAHQQPSAEARDQADRLLAAAGLTEHRSLLPKALSAGMAKRAELLRAWIADPSYFVGDEPFTALDPHTRRALHGLWAQLRKERPRTGLLCTHDPEEAVALCDAVLVMHRTSQGVEISNVELGGGSAEDARRRISDLMDQS